MIWRGKSFTLDLTKRAAVMGVLNVTDDSFSDGGRFLCPSDAVAHALAMLDEGAEILDVGGESTRPGADPVPVEEELRRTIPVIRAIAEARPCVISIDTSKAAVAREAIRAGAAIINDVTGLRGDPRMLGVACETGAALVVMHMQGNPKTMQAAPEYTDVVAEIRAFFEERFAALTAAGIAPEAILWDPGIGFGKTLDHNLALLRALPDLAVGRRPVGVGVSRKSFIGKLLGSDAIEDREWPTVALSAYLRELGTRLVRVHAVRPNVHAVRMAESILEAA